MAKKKSAPRPQAQANKKLKGPARTIHDLERPPQNAEGGRYFGEGHPDNIDVPEPYDDRWAPNRTTWRGGADANNPDKEDELVDLASRALTAHSPTDALLLSVEYGLSKSQGVALHRHDAELRLRAARSELAGLPKPKGRPPTGDLEQVCHAVAKEHFERALGLKAEAREQSSAALFKKHLGLVDTIDSKPSNDKKIAPYERYFEEHKDRLMLRVSDTHVLDQMRKARFVAALKELRALGVEVDVDFIEQNWEVL